MNDIDSKEKLIADIELIRRNIDANEENGTIEQSSWLLLDDLLKDMLCDIRRDMY